MHVGTVTMTMHPHQHAAENKHLRTAIAPLLCRYAVLYSCCCAQNAVRAERLAWLCTLFWCLGQIRSPVTDLCSPSVLQFLQPWRWLSFVPFMHACMHAPSPLYARRSVVGMQQAGIELPNAITPMQGTFNGTRQMLVGERCC